MSLPHILNPLNSLNFDIFPYLQTMLFIVWERIKWWRSHESSSINWKIHPTIGNPDPTLFCFPNDQRAGSPDTGMSTRRREPERAESSWLTQSTSCALLIDRNCGPSIMCCPPRRLKLLSLIHVLIDHVIHILDLRLCFRDHHNWAESGSLGNSKFRSVHSSLFHYYELRSKNNLLSHHFSRALSDFPLLSQILAQ